MTEHLDADRFAAAAADMLLLDVAIDRGYLFHIQFARQDYDVRKLGIELQGFGVRDVELGREMYLLTDTVGVLHDRDIAGDDSIYTYGVGFIHYLTHQRQVFGIHDGIDRQVGLHPCFATGSYDGSHVVGREVNGRTSTHVKVLNTEIDAGSSGLYRRSQTLPASDRSHYFNLFFRHASIKTECS